MRLYTYYDKELKAQAFMLKSSEGYSRTTDTKLSIDESLIDTSSVYYYTVPVTVDVLRDVDSEFDVARLEVYDNDELLKTIEWDSNTPDELKSFIISLDYDVEHNIIAKYTGNRKSLPSHSMLWSHSEVTPAIFISDLKLTSNKQLNVGESTITGLLSYGDNSPINNATVKVIIDDDAENPITVLTNNGVFSFTSSFDIGLHNLRFEFDGGDDCSSASLTESISVGYNVSIEDYTRVWANNLGSVKVNVSDWFGLPINNLSVELYDIMSQNTIVTGLTNSDGDVVLSNNNKLVSVFNELIVKCGDISSDVININSIGVDSLDVTGDSICADGIHTPYTVSAVLSEDVDGLIVDLVNTTSSTVELVDGVGTVYYDGTGVGETNITASVGGLTKKVDITDTIMYWNTTKQYNYSYYPLKGTMSKQNGGFRIEPKLNEDIVMIGLGNLSSIFDFDYELSFDVLASNANQITYGNCDGTGWFEKQYLDKVELKSNDKVVFLNKGNTCQFKVNDNIISSVDRLDKPFFGLVKYLQDKVYLVINNLVIKRI